MHSPYDRVPGWPPNQNADPAFNQKTDPASNQNRDSASNQNPASNQNTVPASNQNPASNKNDASTYRGMLWRSDRYVGQLTAMLKAKGMWSNSLIVYSADNGGRGQG